MPITPLKTKFGKLIRDYLRSAEIRQNDLAARLQISGSAVSQMLHGKIVPNQQQLNVICELLQLDRAQAFELQSMLSCIRTGAENMRSPFNEVMFALRCQRGLTHQQLADCVCSDRVTVARIVSELGKAGILGREGGSYLLRRPDLLRDVAFDRWQPSDN